MKTSVCKCSRRYQQVFYSSLHLVGQIAQRQITCRRTSSRSLGRPASIGCTTHRRVSMGGEAESPGFLLVLPSSNRLQPTDSQANMCNTEPNLRLLRAAVAPKDQQTPAATSPSPVTFWPSSSARLSVVQRQQIDASSEPPFGTRSHYCRLVGHSGWPEALRSQNDSPPHLTAAGTCWWNGLFTWFCWRQNPIRTPYSHFAGNSLSQRAVNRSGRLLPDSHD